MPNIGMAKHRKSGRATKSPSTRHAEKREAEQSERKARPSICNSQSVSDLLASR